MTQEQEPEVIYGKTYVQNNVHAYIYIDTAHVLLVSVGLAQARPNYIRSVASHAKGYQDLPFLTFCRRRVWGEPGNGLWSTCSYHPVCGNLILSLMASVCSQDSGTT